MKKLCFFVFSIVMIFNLSAKEHDFTIGASFGSLTGLAQEVVYSDLKSDNKLSELLWNFNSLTYLGLDIKYSWLRPGNYWGLFSSGSLKYGLFSEPDLMEDRDWIITKNPNWLTHYSIHDNKTESANLIDFNLGASFLFSQNLLLKSYISYHYMNFSFIASGGSVLYPTVSKDKDTGEYRADHYYLPPINVGKYEQTWHIFSPAMSLYGEFNRYFDIEISLEATPFIWCVAIDEHLLRDLVITDVLIGGLFIEPSLLFSYKPSEHYVLSLSCAYRKISDSRGNTRYKYAGQPAIIEKNLSGAGYAALDTGIIAKYKF